jgi:hypothetical protein
MAVLQSERPPSQEAAGSFSTQWLGGANHVCRIQAFRSLLALKLDSFTLVQRLVPILLNGGKVDEHILSRGPLNETVTLSPIEPFHNALLFHVNSFRSCVTFAEDMSETAKAAGIRLGAWRQLTVSACLLRTANQDIKNWPSEIAHCRVPPICRVARHTFMAGIPVERKKNFARRCASLSRRRFRTLPMQSHRCGKLVC